MLGRHSVRKFCSSSSTPPSRILVVGLGWWAQGWHLPHLHRNSKAEIVGIVDPTRHPTSPLASLTGVDMKSVDVLSKVYGAPHFDTLEDALSVVEDVDGVLIATNHASHHALSVEAMRAGMNVFCEKPMTVDVDEAKELAKIAKETGVTFMVNNTANWRDQAIRAKNMVFDGEIGDIRHGTVLFHGPLHFVFEDPNNTLWNEPSGNMVGNGFGWGQLAHPLAWFFMVSGLIPASVFSFNGISDKTPADLYNAVAIECTNGATISVSGCGKIPGNAKIVDHRLIGTEGLLSYTGVAGDKGVTDGDEGGLSHLWQGLTLNRFDGRNEIIPGFDYEDTDADCDGPESLKAFLAACRGEPYESGTDADVGLRTVATIDAIYRSAKSRKAEPTNI